MWKDFLINKFSGSSTMFLLNPFSKILLIIMGGILLSTGIYTVKLVLENKDLKIEIADLNADNIHLQSELDKCKIELTDVNDAIIAIAEKAKDDLDLIAETNDELKNRNRANENEIERLKSRPAPKTCEESKDLLFDNLDIFEIR